MLYSSNNTLINLPTEYGRNGVCTGTNNQDFFVYRINSTIVLVDLGMEVSAHLNKEDCAGVDNEILILQERFIIATNQLDGLCRTNLFDIGGNYLSAIISQDGYYSSVGIITGFSEPTTNANQTHPTTVPPVTKSTTQETTVSGLPPSPPPSRSDLYSLAVLTVIPFFLLILLLILYLSHVIMR